MVESGPVWRLARVMMRLARASGTKFSVSNELVEQHSD